MNYKLTSCKSLIAKVYRDFKPESGDFEYNAIEWIGEVIEFIGFHGIFPEKKKVLKVKDHRTPFPCGFFELVSIYYNGVKLPYKGGDNYSEYINIDRYAAAQKYMTISNDQTAKLVVTEQKTPGKEFFIFSPGYIQTSFASGKIGIVYNSIPVDEEGYPLIPDNVYFKDAAFWYIVSRMLLGGFKHPKFDFNYADELWEIKKVKAENELAFPTPEKMEHFRNMWVRLIPDVRPEDMYEQDEEFVEDQTFVERPVSILQGSTINAQLQDKVKELEDKLNQLIQSEVGTDEKVLNLTEPATNTESPNPSNANYYVGDDYIYVYVNGIWKRHSIYNW